MPSLAQSVAGAPARIGLTPMRVGALITLVVMAVIVAPIVIVAAGSVWSAPFIRLAGGFTLDNYVRFLTAPDTGELLFTTLELTVGASTIAMVTGGLLAWIVARTDVPLRRLLWFLPMSSLLLTGLLRDIAWIGLYSPQVGLVNLALMRLLGLSEPVFNIFSLTGVIVTMGVSLAPIPYLILLGPLTSMNRSLEEASRASGATPMLTLWHVTLPLLRPALLSGLTLSAIIVAHAFETPVIIGLPGGVHTFMATIYSSMSTTPNYSLASAQSMTYLALIGILLWWYRRTTSVEARFALITGRGHAPGLVRLGPWRWAMFAVVLLHFIVTFVQLLAAAVFLSLLPFFTVTGTDLPPMSLDNYVAALNEVGTANAIRTSLGLAAQVAVLTVVTATVLSLVAFKTKMRFRRWVELVGTLPVAFPPLVFSVALLISFLSVPGMAQFYNTPMLLVLAMVVVFLPYALRVVSSAIISVDDELLEASASSGAGIMRTLGAIVMPLTATALTNAATIVLVLSFRELGAVALVVPPGMDLLPAQIFGLWQSGKYGSVYALNVLTFLFSVVALVGARGIILLISRVTLRSADPLPPTVKA